jgi:hypothetical protein
MTSHRSQKRSSRVPANRSRFPATAQTDRPATVPRPSTLGAPLRSQPTAATPERARRWRPDVDRRSGFAARRWGSMPAGFAVCLAVRGEEGWTVDFCYEYVNAAASRLNGLAREQTLGRGIRGAVPGFSGSRAVPGPASGARVTGEPSRREAIVYERDWHARTPVVRALRAAWSRSATVSPSVGAR